MLKRLKKSITVQMTLLVLGSTALVLALVETYSYVHTRDMILETGESVAIHLTRSMTRRIEQEFRAVEKVITFLNRYLGKMVDILMAHRGVIDEIIGDGILAFFGAPESLEDHTARAVACALEMQTAMAAFPTAWVNFMGKLSRLHP